MPRAPQHCLPGLLTWPARVHPVHSQAAQYQVNGMTGTSECGPSLGLWSMAGPTRQSELQPRKQAADLISAMPAIDIMTTREGEEQKASSHYCRTSTAGFPRRGTPYAAWTVRCLPLLFYVVGTAQHSVSWPMAGRHGSSEQPVEWSNGAVPWSVWAAWPSGQQ